MFDTHPRSEFPRERGYNLQFNADRGFEKIGGVFQLESAILKKGLFFVSSVPHSLCRSRRRGLGRERWPGL